MDASAIGGLMASACITRLFDKVCSFAGDQYEYQRDDAKDKLKRLRNSLWKIEAVVRKAESLQTKNPSRESWLGSIKDVAYQAEDVLDLFDYRDLQAKAEDVGKVTTNLFDSATVGSSSSTTSATTITTTSATTSSSSKVKRVVKRSIFFDEDLNELISIVDIFDKIATEMKTFLELVKLEDRRPEQPAQWRKTTSMPGTTKFFGRVNEEKRLKNLLMQTNEQSSQPYAVISVVGIAGVGKTALVQRVYSHFLDTIHFDFTAWLHVSDKFDLERLTKEMVLSISADLNSISSLDQVQWIIRNKLNGKRILVVLDDVWNEMSSQWENLCKPLRFASKGSKVIVTTRSQNVANMNGTTEMMHLHGLEDEDYWSHFSQSAFGDANPSDFPQLESIGRQLVNKLAGSPLAAKTVGGSLKLKLDEDHWRAVCGSKLWQIEQKEDDIIPALRLSYDHLPDHLKQCFVYFALFPRNYQLRSDVLIQMWRAHGFLNKETPDEIAYRYINDLLQLSFIQKAANLEDHYVVHDLLHDFAESVSNGEHFRIEDDFCASIPRNVRHLNNLSLCWNSLKEDIINTEHEGVFEGLRPNRNLKELHVASYMGTKSPTWLTKEYVSNIHIIELVSCHHWKTLPPFGSLPFLRILKIRHLTAVEKIDAEFYGDTAVAFPSLEELLFEGMDQWKEWSSVESSPHIFPRLCDINIRHCKKLMGPLPLPLPLSGIKISLSDRSSNIISSESEKTTEVNTSFGVQLFLDPIELLFGCLQTSSLATVHVLDISSYRLVAFNKDQEEWLQQLTSVKEVRFTDCPKLTSLPSNMIGLTSLVSLYVEKCPELVPFPPQRGLPLSLHPQLPPRAQSSPALPTPHLQHPARLLLCDHRDAAAAWQIRPSPGSTTPPCMSQPHATASSSSPPQTRCSSSATWPHASFGRLAQLEGFRFLGFYPCRPTAECRLLLYWRSQHEDPVDDGETAFYIFALGCGQPKCIMQPAALAPMEEALTRVSLMMAHRCPPVLVRGSLHWYPVQHRTTAR